MKTMRALANIAQDLYESVSAQISEPLRTHIFENLESGEEGVVVDNILDWAIESNVSINEKFWSELVDFYEPLNDRFDVITKANLAKVAHAA